MNHRVRAAAVLATATAVAAIAGRASASPVAIASGGATETSQTPTSMTQFGEDVVIRGTTTGALTGTLTGTNTETFTLLIQPDGHIVYLSKGTFTGTLGDCGAVTVEYAAILKGTLSAFTGFFTSIGGRGGPSFQATVIGGGPAFTYTGVYHC